MKRKNIDKSKYDWKPVNYVNGVPWPRLKSDTQKNEVPLKEKYLLCSMDYLDTDQARIIFESQASIIMENTIKGIIDVGCRVGTINDILHDAGYVDYTYMGFDTSSQPIAYANEKWRDFKNIEYRNISWEDRDSLDVGFDVDCVIWSGVLCYCPTYHADLFHSITVDLYKSTFAIIQEPCEDQTFWDSSLQLHTIEHELHTYKERYANYEEKIVEAKVFSGRRKIVKITI